MTYRGIMQNIEVEAQTRTAQHLYVSRSRNAPIQRMVA